MSPRDVFGIVVRTVGLLAFLQGSRSLWIAIAAERGSLPWDAVLTAGVGLYLLSGAQALVDWSYAPSGSRRSKRRGRGSRPMHVDRPSVADRQGH